MLISVANCAIVLRYYDLIDVIAGLLLATQRVKVYRHRVKLEPSVEVVPYRMSQTRSHGTNQRQSGEETVERSRSSISAGL